MYYERRDDSILLSTVLVLTLLGRLPQCNAVWVILVQAKMFINLPPNSKVYAVDHTIFNTNLRPSQLVMDELNLWK